MLDPAASVFLSETWFNALRSGLQRAAVSELPAVAIGQKVTELPSASGGDICYTVEIGGGRPAKLTVGSTAAADVWLVMSYRDALAMATGETTGASLLASGAVKIRGNAAMLVNGAPLLEAVCLGDLHRIVT